MRSIRRIPDWRFLASSVAVLLALASPAAQRVPAVDDRASWAIRVEFPSWDSQLGAIELSLLRPRDAARRLATEPDSPATVRALIAERRFADALSCLRTIAATRPERLAEALSSIDVFLREMIHDGARGYAQQLREIAASARTVASTLPREDGAKLGRLLVGLDSELGGRRDFHQRLASFADEFAGTDAALLARADLLTQQSGPAMLAPLDAFIAAHPGTTAAAKALHSKGFHLANNPFSFGERPGHDPTDRFFRVVEIASALRSGQYPPSEWVDKARELVTGFHAYRPTYAAGNIDRVLAVYETELPALLDRYVEAPWQSSISFVISTRIGELLSMRGDPLPGLDAVLDRLEQKTGRTEAVRFLRAEISSRPMGAVLEKLDRQPMLRRAVEILEPLSRGDTGYFPRKALAMLAAIRFNEGAFEPARSLFRRYVELHPSSSYAWAAALRAAQCEEALGSDAAPALFRQVADQFGSNPAARIIARTYAARAAEATGDFRGALEDYEAAAAAWADDFAQRLNIPSFPTKTAAMTTVNDSSLERDTLAARVRELKRTLSMPGGALLERGRWLIGRGRWSDAAVPLGEFLALKNQSALAPEGRALLHRARLEEALDLVDADQDGTNVKTAAKALEALSREKPVDFAVCAARIALATLTSLGRSLLDDPAGDPDALMTDAIAMWRGLDRPPKGARTPFEQDVIAIRNQVFRPRGDGVFAGTSWNGFQWSAMSAPNAVVNPALRVKSNTGEISTVVVTDAFPDLGSVLFLHPDRRAILERVMVRLGGTKRFAWTEVMETPNRPAGPSLDVLAFWKKSIWVQPGHWGGWVLEAYPIITEIEFVDVARTRAAVKVTVGYAGATVQMHKENGVWIARALTNQWVT